MKFYSSSPVLSQNHSIQILKAGSARQKSSHCEEYSPVEYRSEIWQKLQTVNGYAIWQKVHRIQDNIE
jgi:hypothetical protein